MQIIFQLIHLFTGYISELKFKIVNMGTHTLIHTHTDNVDSGTNLEILTFLSVSKPIVFYLLIDVGLLFKFSFA